MFEIVEMVSTLTGRPIFEVVENDNWKYPALGRFKTKSEAEAFIIKINEDLENDHQNNHTNV